MNKTRTIEISEDDYKALVSILDKAISILNNGLDVYGDTFDEGEDYGAGVMAEVVKKLLKL
jgi:hypothetical protein